MVVDVGSVAVVFVLLAGAGSFLALYGGLGAGVWGGDSGGLGILGAWLSMFSGAFMGCVGFLFMDGVSTLSHGC